MNDNLSKYLCFSLGHEHYAMPLLTVREVIGVPQATPMPFMPAHFLGIFNLRGAIISVVDMRLKFGMKPVNSVESAVIVCDLGNVSIGVLVDSIDSVLTVTLEQIAEKPQTLDQKKLEFVQGVVRQDDKLILIIDVARSLDLADHKAIEKMNKENKVA